MQYPQNSNGNDVWQPQTCLWPNITTVDPWLHNEFTDVLGFSASLTNFIEPQNSFSQPCTASADDANLLMSLSGASDLPFAFYTWDPGFGISAANDPAGFAPQQASLSTSLETSRQLRIPLWMSSTNPRAGLCVAEVDAMALV